MSSLSLQVLGVLKVLAGGNSFQDVATFSSMSVTTAEQSFHHFCKEFSQGLWDTWVKLPVGEDLDQVEHIYRKCGFPGAVGSVDCTHFKWDGCPFSEQRIHKGKEGYASVVVEAMCDHAGRILSATKSYPGAENDVTVIARDKSVWRIRDEEPWKSLKYSLHSADGSLTEHKGAWLIVDGGYPKIPLLIPPFKTHRNLEDHMWSRRVESVRKDIECCFGRVKGRWRLFRGGILFNTREKIDNAWFTACILHNMLHTFNGLDKMEEESDWVGSAGEVDSVGEAKVAAAQDTEEFQAPGFVAFRQRLVAHFKYAWDHKAILWFKRASV
ncbi:unnamed protein product [Scytosiphon promiscuus]